MITNTIAGHGAANGVTFHLLTVMAVYAALIFMCRRQWIKPNEIWLIGAAVIFWSIAWLLGPTIPVIRARFPELTSAIPVSIGVITPFIGAMLFGLFYVRKIVLKINNMPSQIETKKTSVSPKRKKI